MHTLRGETSAGAKVVKGMQMHTLRGETSAGAKVTKGMQMHTLRDELVSTRLKLSKLV